MNTIKQLAVALAVAATAFAQTQAGAASNPASNPATSTTVAQAAVPTGDMAEGEVRKVDKEAAKLTLRHGEIRSLDMPAMTMVFNVRDKALLDNLKAGDKVLFKAVNDAGRYTVTDMQLVR